MTGLINYSNVSRWTRTLLLLAVSVVAIIFAVVCLVRLKESKTVSLSLFTNVPSAFQTKQPSPVQSNPIPQMVPPDQQAVAQPQVATPDHQLAPPAVERTKPALSYEPNAPLPSTVLYQSPPLTVNPGPCPTGEERKKPDVIIIGIRKAGTKAILSYLDLHTQIRVTEQDEIHYFDMNNNYYLGDDWYLSKMPCTAPGQLTIEKTPAYFFRDYVPERVHWMNPRVKLLVVVREPVERAISDYMQVLSSIYNYDMNQTFEQLAILEDTGEVDAEYTAVQWSIYYQYMHNWLHWFSLEQFYFIRANDLFTNPSQALEGVEEFLGLQHEITEDMFYFNQTRGFFCLHKPDGTDYCMPETKGRPHPPVDPSVIKTLKEFFAPYNELFYHTVGQNFGW